MTGHDVTIHPAGTEWITCECGNDPRSDGFDTVDANGTVIEPNVWGTWDGLYRCDRCGRLHRIAQVCEGCGATAGENCEPLSACDDPCIPCASCDLAGVDPVPLVNPVTATLVSWDVAGDHRRVVPVCDGCASSRGII